MENRETRDRDMAVFFNTLAVIIILFTVLNSKASEYIPTTQDRIDACVLDSTQDETQALIKECTAWVKANPIK